MGSAHSACPRANKPNGEKKTLGHRKATNIMTPHWADAHIFHICLYVLPGAIGLPKNLASEACRQKQKNQ